MRYDCLVRVDHRKAAGLDALFLAQSEQAVEELLINLEHFDELHQSAVGDVQLAVETVGAGIRLDPNLADRREIDRPRELGYVL